LQAPLLASDILIRPWRTATLVASLIAAVELVALIILGAIVLAGPLTSGGAKRHAAAARVLAKRVTGIPAVPLRLAPVELRLSRARTGILVLNGNGRTGAAAAEAAVLHRLGYKVQATGNAGRHDFATSVVMYRPGYRAAGVRLARDLHLKVVGPLDGLRPAALRGAKLALVLGVG
jgi:hypothetical protein